MYKTLLASAVVIALLGGRSLHAATPQDAQTAPEQPATGQADQASSPKDQADVQILVRNLQMLKVSYAEEVRRLRELDAQVQALQARLQGKTSTSPLPAQRISPTPVTAPAQNGQALASTEAATVNAGSSADAAQANQAAQSRSMEDALQQQNASFSRKLTIEDDLSYSRYDRSELTLNGFLALDSIFLGNISVDKVSSDSLTYDLITRYGVSPRLTLNLDIPYILRRTVYQKGGAGGSAAALAEESTSGNGVGDLNLTANYKLLTETASRPDTVLTFGVIAPTGRAPYGINWNTVSVPGDQYLQFAVPSRQPTGNGLWQGTVGGSVVKTMDPAIVFANLGYIHSFPRGFADIDTDPQTTTPGSVKLGDAYYFGAGVAFAFNERASLSLSFSDRINGQASLRPVGTPWTKVVGSEANAGTLNIGMTYALDQHTTLVTLLGVGMTQDAPDFMLTFKIPYIF